MQGPSTFNDLQSWLACLPRGRAGWFTDGTLHKPPTELLHLYEFEGCPFCRKVRECLSELDIDYVSHPCGRGSPSRAGVRERGGKEMFPFLVDPNTGRELYESEDIIDYVRATYGRPRPRYKRALAPLNTAGSALASLLRPRGRRTLPSTRERGQPEKLPELWQFEMSPFCRKVREALLELNLDYRVHNVAKGGRQRPDLVALGGKMQVPYLVDPNTGTAMYESDDIVAYLHKTYSGTHG